jgi:four helix bundle protein
MFELSAISRQLSMRNFHELKVWQKAHHLTLAVYSATRSFPKEEVYGLTSQLRRAASSIPSNSSEGCGRNSKPDFLRFLHIAAGSASELEYHLLLAHDLDLLGPTLYMNLTDDVTEVKKDASVVHAKADG